MADAVVVPKWLKRLPLAPEFYPTETEFADPVAYISKIEKKASAFGICKIIPPIPKPSKKYVFQNVNRSLSKRPELGLDVNFRVGGGKNQEEGRAVFTTRQQELGHCMKGTKGMGDALQVQPTAQKKMWQSGEFYTIEQFEAKAKAFSRDVLSKVEEVSPLVVETLFWKAACEKAIYVEYANDVPGSAFSEPMGRVRHIHKHKTRGRSRVFTQNKCVSWADRQAVVTAKDTNMNEEIDASIGKGTSTTSESGKVSVGDLTSLPDKGLEDSRQEGLPHNHVGEGTAGWKLSNSPWNLQVISRSAGSLTRFMLDDIPGVTSPMIYIGMLFSWFAWHVEDHELHSLNFLHTGSPKTWYAVPGEYAFAFEEVICKEAYSDNMDTLAALAILGEKTTIVSPEVVTRRGIPCCRLIQNPGEFVVTFPRAYHIGFSHGFNCGEAANFGTPEWLNVAKEAAVRRTIMDHLPMLSHQQLLYLLTMSFVSRIPVSILPGIRSSRLRNRQKEARELLVKKAFIVDVLESNNLVNDLLQKDSTFRAVLWNSNSLTPLVSESIPETGISSESLSPKNDKPAVCLKNDNDLVNLYEQIILDIQTMEDLDIVDLSGDFEISSGTLPCVACGVLGFPYMCVVQPSRKASMNILPADFISVHGTPQALHIRTPKPGNDFMDPVSAMATEFDERWNSSCGFLRPRIFCLEHAIQTEELLRPKGGANMLVICHSDFQKIQPTAAVVAEEIGSVFGYNEVSLDFASIQDLNLINLAVDDEANNCREDWTSNLGINLKRLVKTRKNSPEKPLEHKLKLCGFFPFATPMPDMSKIRWTCRKHRMKRLKSKSTCQEHVKSCGIISEKKDEAVEGEVILRSSDIVHIKKDETVSGNADGCMLGKLNVRFQYSRRKCRSKSDKLVEPRSAVECPIKHSDDVTNCGDICSGERDMLAGHGLNNRDTNNVLFSIPASVQGHLEESETTRNAVESCILDDQEFQQPSSEIAAEYVSSQIKNCTNEELKIEIEGNVQLSVENNARTSEISEISDAENSCLSSIMSPGSSVDREKCMENGNNVRSDAQNVLKPKKTFEGCMTGADEEDIAKENSLDVPERTISCVAENNDIFQDKFVMDIEVSDCRALEIAHENDRHMKEHVSTHGHLATSKLEIVSPATLVGDAPGCAREDLETNSLHLGILSSGCLVNRQSDGIDACAVDVETTSRNRKRGKREVMLLGYRLNQGGFVKSPCEGLRPRIRKEEFNGQPRRDTAEVAEEPPSKKKKPSKNSGSGNEEGMATPKGSYRCNVDQCQMHFQTKAELSRHKQNRCANEGCGKRFSSHRKPVNHQRVHDKEQCLECTWKGCKMTFNSESNMMEHMRTHIGARPYQCEFEGCGVAFRYPSELSRHRRRTGHDPDHSAPV